MKLTIDQVAMDQILATARACSQLPSPEVRRAIRERAAVTQQNIAATLGVTAAAISYWESGRRVPRGQLLQNYVHVLRALDDARKGQGQ